MNAIEVTLLAAVTILTIVTAAGLLVVAVELGRLMIRLDPSRSDMALVPGEGLERGDHVPDVHLTSFPDGSALSMTAGPTLLVFVAASCEPCRRLWPGLGRLARQRKDLSVIAVVADDPLGLGGNGRVGERVATVFDSRGDIAAAFGVRRTPFAYVIWAGLVRAKGVVNRQEHVVTLLEGHGLPAPTEWAARSEPT